MKINIVLSQKEFKEAILWYLQAKCETANGIKLPLGNIKIEEGSSAKIKKKKNHE